MYKIKSTYKNYLHANVRLGDEAIPLKSQAHTRKRRRISEPPDSSSNYNEVFEQANIISNDQLLDDYPDNNIDFVSAETPLTEPVVNRFEDIRNIIFEDPVVEVPTSKKRNLTDFINDNGFDEPINIPVRRTKGEIFLMLLKYSIHNTLSAAATRNLFKLVNTLFPDSILPDTKYILDQLLNTENEVEYHAVCHNCTAYVGEFKKIRDNTSVCKYCKKPLDLKNPSNTSFFAIINPSLQISSLLSLHSIYYDDCVSRRIYDSNRNIRDIYDGKKYREFVKSLGGDKNFVSAIFNTDGAPKFKSTKCSVWPIYLQILEIPPQDRMNKIITCGLWFHKKKPDMNVFLNPFVDMINNLTSNPFEVKINEEVRKLKLYVLVCCVDSGARGPIQGIKQFNGDYACSWCLHPGGSKKYPVIMNIDVRTHDETVKIMTEDDLHKPVLGIKCASELINLEKFDIVSGMVPDYMHACLEGVGEQILEYLLDLMDSEDIKEIDKNLKKMSVPNLIAKAVKLLTSRDDWKARDKENFDLFYSLVVFKNRLSADKYRYWTLFVESLYILLKDDISPEELDLADAQLHEFVALTQKNCGASCMTYNIHQHLHLSQSVLDWGPLWAHSCFPFESANYKILKVIKSAKGVPQQVVRYLNMVHSESVVREHVYENASYVVREFCDDILSGKMKEVFTVGKNTYCGKAVEASERLCSHLNLSPDFSKEYEKLIINRCLFTSEPKKQLKNDNSYVRLQDGQFMQIEKFIVDTKTKIEITVGRLIKIKKFQRKSQILREIESMDSKPTYVSTSLIDRICVHMSSDNAERFIIPVPNTLHY